MSKTRRGNGEGSVIYEKDRNRYRGTITISNGNRKSVYGKTKKEVVAKMDNLKADITLGVYCDKSDLTVEGYLIQFIENEYRKNLVKEVTYMRKKAILRKIQEHPIAQMRIQAVTEAQIEDFLYSLTDYSNSLITKEYALLKRCFEDNVPEVLKVNPMRRIKCPKSKKEEVKQRALTLAEQKRLTEVLNNEDVLYREQMLIMLNTGMRMGEINALMPEDINLVFNTVTVSRTITKNEKDRAIIGSETKTKAGHRIIPLSKVAQGIFGEVLRNYIPNSQNLLFAVNNHPIATSYVNMEFAKICKDYDIIDKSVKGKVSLHSLRHTYATRCIEGGMSAKVLQSLLGHTDIRITMNTYCDAFEQFKTDDINKVEDYLNRVLI